MKIQNNLNIKQLTAHDVKREIWRCSTVYLLLFIDIRLNRSRIINKYENRKYNDKGLNSISNMENMYLEHTKRVNVSVPEINTYLRWLRNEISN